MSLDSVDIPSSSQFLSHLGATGGVFPRRAHTLTSPDDVPVCFQAHSVTVYMYVFNPENEEDRIVLDFHKRATTEELIERILHIRHDLTEHTADEMELVEVMGTPDGHTFKERKLDAGEYPVAVQSLWGGRALSSSTSSTSTDQAPKHRFILRHKGVRSVSRFGSAEAASAIDAFLAKFLTQPQDREYADLCMLPELTEQTLLDNLRDRFNSGHIYTYIGPILVAVNPFSFFPIYNPKYARLYCSSALGSLPPHIFAIADVTYHNMLRIKENQCIVISGESGSGKTESTNFLLHHLTTLSQKGSTGCSVEQTLLSAGPVLEAFGNAVTVQNNNSSRFGKFIKVNYRENGMVSGANMEIYLLEKSRIISQAVGERNYHVFYYLLEGASDDERKEFFLMKPDDYMYLNQNTYEATEGVNEKYEWSRLKQAMLAVGFPPTTQHTLQAILSAVLLLGNIKYIKRQGYHSDEAAYIENEEVVGLVAKLLNIRADQLLQALTMRRTVTKNDTVISRYSVSEATNTRDAMAKCLYNALFHWIVLRINQQLLRAQSPTNGYYIGILDIFGFEDVGGHKNSFEQLCINYANEHLQAYFNQHIFQFEQEEYLKEGITWTNIEYTDNTECVHLFQAKPYGILRLIDEESNIHNGTDQSMLDKLNTFLKNNEYYEMPQKREKAFIVAHYAGKVKYQTTGFREKNKDLMRHDVLITLKNSKYSLVRELVGSDPVAVYRWTLIRSVFRALYAFKQAGRKIQRSESAGHLGVRDEDPSRGRRSSDSQLSAFLRGELRLSIPDFCDTSVFGTITSQARRSMHRPQKERLSTLKSLQILREAIGRRRVTSAKPASVSRQFEYSLIRLMSTLGAATPYFIRCIKSNNEKIANHFDEDIILRQLRYTGMLETVRIRRAGYSVRIEYQAFINQYRILLPYGRESQEEDVKNFIQNHPLIQEDNVQYGLTKVFMRDAEKLILDDFLHRTIMQHIVTLQRWFRTVLARKKYLRLRNGVIRIQAMFRGMQLRNRLRHESYAALVIQANWRRYREEKRYNQLKSSILALQAAYRGALTRKRIGDIPRKGANRFHITKIHTFQLPKFDLNNPASLAEFATSSDECSSGEESDDGLDLTPSEGDVFGNYNDDNVDLDVAFTLEDTKLKLIEEEPTENAFHRRQSLAATASTAKLKMLRRAASTESDQIARKGETLRTLDELSNVITKKKTGSGKIGFQKAKRNLKGVVEGLFGRRSDSGAVSEGDDDHPSTSHPDIHSLKVQRLRRAEPCALCAKQLSGLLAQALKCSRCKMTFHKECSSFAPSLPCSPTSPLRSPTRLEPPRKPWEIRGSRQARQSGSPSSAQLPRIATSTHPTFNLTQTKQQTDPMSLVVECVDDLRLFSVFMFKKLTILDQDKKKRDTIVDSLFKKSMREFHMELIGYEAVLTEERTVLRYKDLITTFEGLLTKVTFPLPLGVNAFRGFLNEFVSQQSKLKKNRQKTGIIRSYRKKRRRSDVTVIHAGHRFRGDFVHVPTYCELCNEFMWHAEKIFICTTCKISVHKRCHTKISAACMMAQAPTGTSSGRFFGATITSLAEDEQGIPAVLNKLLTTIELRALFVEGLYRKSGSMAQVRVARRAIETAAGVDEVTVDDIPVHVLSTLVKSFFRELPDPLITYDLYENFLNVSEVTAVAERVRCLSVMIDLLPKNNKCVLDRLMYHLARVAHQEPVNRMGASNLALIFGPCLMRRQHAVHAQDTLVDVSRQAVCVQALIEEKLRQYRVTLINIVELEAAQEKVEENIRKITEHISRGPSAESHEQCKLLFEEQLDFLTTEKDKLTHELPSLAPVASSEDLSSSDERSFSPCRDEFAIDMSSPPVFGLLNHPNKSRPRGPRGRKSPKNSLNSLKLQRIDEGDVFL
ncbi:unnamed protein product, partial [Mesorhabditis belari]|uniref:Unconventional myosin-IXb n=1 Tax=Mesorhabditis belari TaxID=2138241 RepID=A0AAF3ESW8_9BILA